MDAKGLPWVRRSMLQLTASIFRLPCTEGTPGYHLLITTLATSASGHDHCIERGRNEEADATWRGPYCFAVLHASDIGCMDGSGGLALHHSHRHASLLPGFSQWLSPKHPAGCVPPCYNLSTAC
eukprot:251863-Chlamydomonas_euryale.AAC.12